MFPFSPIHLPWNDGTVCHDWMQVSWMLSFKPAFSLSSFTFIKRLFSFSSLSAIRVVSSAYLIFLLAILIPAWDSFSQAFHMMHSTYKLNKQEENIQPWCTPFPILNQSTVPCLVLSVDSWPAHRFLRKRVRWSGIPISWRIFHSLLIHIVKSLHTVNEAKVDVFLEFSCFFVIQWLLAIWSLVPLLLLNPACTSGHSWFTYCLSLAWMILSITILACKTSTIMQ